MILLNRQSLQNLVKRKDLVGAEIGVLQGVNSKDILEKLSIKKLYLIDNWTNGKSNKDIVTEKLEEFETEIVILNGYSSEMHKHIKDEELDFIYIDGDHKYEGVRNDIKNYYYKVKIGGLVAGHDYGRAKTRGVTEAVNEFFGEKNINIVHCLDHDLNRDWWIWKT